LRLVFDHQRLSRRQLLRLVGTAGGITLIGGVRRAEIGRLLSGLTSEAATAAQAATLACILSPAKTEGPYFVDERLNRSDIRVDPSNGSVQAGVALRLKINVYDAESSCAPIQGATVDVWHANASGVYSDVSANNTVGRKFLRGLQTTDANGLAEFVTIYPGWYSGRAIHIHFKVRKFDGSAKTYEFTSQIFFDDATNNAVMARSPYNSRGTPDTRDGTDNVYGSDGAKLLATLASDGTGGYLATYNVGLSGLPTGSSSADATVAASLVSARVGRTGGGRRLTLTLKLGEVVAVDARVLRGSKLLARRKVTSVKPGTRRAAVVIGRNVAAGGARLRLTLTDARGNKKVIQRALTLPAA
jgi:protocatechuate 3,4-dioxygenase beta subunit